MTNTISYGATVLEPRLVLGWEQTRDSLNLEHPIIGGGRDITHTPPSLRTGTLTHFFLTEADVIAAEQLHRAAPYVDLASDERLLMNMRYVLSESGKLTITLAEGARRFTLAVDYREVTP